MSSISSIPCARRCARSSRRGAPARPRRHAGGRNNIMLGLQDNRVIVLGRGSAIVARGSPLGIARISPLMAGTERSQRDDSEPCQSADPPPAKKLLTGLIGAPIAHSASPCHARAGRGGAWPARPLSAHRGRRRRLGRARHVLEGVRRLGFAGVNVTFPLQGGGGPAARRTVTGRGRHRRGQYRRCPRRPADRPQHRHHRALRAPSRRWLHPLEWRGRRDRHRRASARRSPLRWRALASPTSASSTASRASAEKTRRACSSSRVAPGSPQASRTRSTAQRASSTARRSACCRTGIAGRADAAASQPVGRGRRLFAADHAAAGGCPSQGRADHDRPGACDLPGRRRFRTVHGPCPIDRDHGRGF